MLRIIECAASHHDLVVLALACTVCVLVGAPGWLTSEARPWRPFATRALSSGSLLRAFTWVCSLGLAVWIAAAGLAPMFGTGGAIPAPSSVSAAAAGAVILLFSLLHTRIDRQNHRDAYARRRRDARFAAEAFEGLIFESGGFIVDANPKMGSLAGRDVGTLIHTQLGNLFTQPPLKSAPDQLTEHEIVLPDKTTKPVEVIWRNCPEANGRVLAVREISRERLSHVQLQHMTQFDVVTGVANRDRFELQLEYTLDEADRGSNSIALLYVDLDRFDTVYEMFGARASDTVLVQTAARLCALAGPSELVARLGTDQFAIVWTLGNDTATAGALADAVVADLARPVDLDGQSIQVSASVGVAHFPDDGRTVQGLVRSAALALRRAKQEGRGTWRCFEPAIDLRLHDRRNMEHELRQALEEGQLALQYQSFFDSETLEIAGCEALIRWQHPTRGRVSPADFIPLAEESSLILAIGKWVLATACAEAADWERPVTIAVNLSPAQFAHDGIVGDIADVLAQTGLPAERLELEITETTLMADTQRALKILKALKALGAHIAMDDFGTGHSSLGNLRKFPFDKIKIDRSFISEVEDEPGAETIVQTIIAMGHTLGLTITAEGVETSRQLAMLRSHGCTYVQGFLLARPCSAAQLDLSLGHPRWLQGTGNGGTGLQLVPGGQTVAHPVESKAALG